MSANGMSLPTDSYHSGGGAGGSVWLRAVRLLVVDGSVMADGGDGGTHAGHSGGGGGGGGRVCIEYVEGPRWRGVVSASGGEPPWSVIGSTTRDFSTVRGGAGSVVLSRRADASWSSPLVDAAVEFASRRDRSLSMSRVSSDIGSAVADGLVVASLRVSGATVEYSGGLIPCVDVWIVSGGSFTGGTTVLDASGTVSVVGTSSQLSVSSIVGSGEGGVVGGGEEPQPLLDVGDGGVVSGGTASGDLVIRGPSGRRCVVSPGGSLDVGAGGLSMECGTLVVEPTGVVVGGSVSLEGLWVNVSGSVSVGNRAELNVTGTAVVIHSTGVVAGGSVTVIGNAITVWGHVSSDGLGYGDLSAISSMVDGGPGVGMSSAGGGGHGGRGGSHSTATASGGAAYGDLVAPRTWGSAGMSVNTGAGAGGGRVWIQGAAVAIPGGVVSASGSPSTHYQAGGGAGGSVWVRAVTLGATDDAWIRADGGDAVSHASHASGGGGSGGRVCVESFNGLPWRGSMSAGGGVRRVGSTVYGDYTAAVGASGTAAVAIREHSGWDAEPKDLVVTIAAAPSGASPHCTSLCDDHNAIVVQSLRIEGDVTFCDFVLARHIDSVGGGATARLESSVVMLDDALVSATVTVHTAPGVVAVGANPVLAQVLRGVAVGGSDVQFLVTGWVMTGCAFGANGAVVPSAFVASTENGDVYECRTPVSPLGEAEMFVQLRSPDGTRTTQLVETTTHRNMFDFAWGGMCDVLDNSTVPAGCTHAMLGDGVCDAACNSLACRFDNGDCGAAPVYVSTQGHDDGNTAGNATHPFRTIAHAVRIACRFGMRCLTVRVFPGEYHTPVVVIDRALEVVAALASGKSQRVVLVGTTQPALSASGSNVTVRGLALASAGYASAVRCTQCPELVLDDVVVTGGGVDVLDTAVLLVGSVFVGADVHIELAKQTLNEYCGPCIYGYCVMCRLYGPIGFPQPTRLPPAAAAPASNAFHVAITDSLFVGSSLGVSVSDFDYVVHLERCHFVQPDGDGVETAAAPAIQVVADATATGSVAVLNSSVAGWRHAGQGAGLAVTAAAPVWVSVADSSFASCRAAQGSALRVAVHGVACADARLDVSDSRFHRNTASASTGGDVHVDASVCGASGVRVNVSGSLFFKSTAVGSGGALYVDGGMGATEGSNTLMGVASTRIASSRGASGGSMHVLGTSVDVRDSTFEGNAATTGGGGAVRASRASVLTLERLSLQGNRAVGLGGDVLVRLVSLLGSPAHAQDSPGVFVSVWVCACVRRLVMALPSVVIWWDFLPRSRTALAARLQ